jgi:hypothetical protein
MQTRSNLPRLDRIRAANLLISLLTIGLFLSGTGRALAQGATDFAGTVLAVDAAAGKLSVKRADGGTRFTFVVNDKTQFTGGGLKGLADVKKGDSVTVTYVVSGSQYIAQRVAKAK